LVEADNHVARGLASRFRLAYQAEHGYVLILAMLILVAVGLISASLVMQVLANQQHVSRDQAYTESLAVAEAGLNQYLWMVAAGLSSSANSFAIPGNAGPDPHYKQFNLTDIYDDSVKGVYALQVTPPTAQDPRVTVVVTGRATSSADAPRTVTAHLGRPFWCEYLLLTNDEVWIGGPLTRVWHGKTHSNVGICVDTANLSDPMSSAKATYSSSMFGGTHNGVWSGADYTVPSNDPSRALWKFPVPAISFTTVTSDFVRLAGLAVGNGINLPYSTSTAHGSTQGWYIKLLPGNQYQIKRVSGETETSTGTGGTLTLVAPTSPVPSAILNYPTSGVIYVNDNVWVEGTNISGRITIASSGQLNGTGKTAATSIHVVGDLIYSRKDGTVGVGLIAQNNIEIPAYAPWNKIGTLSQIDMEMDAAVIAQQGKEYVTAADLGGPTRDMLTIWGSVCSYMRPYRYNTGTHGGFTNGSNTYDSYLLHAPPPYFPTIGTYQIIDWRELPSADGVLP
jgi:hypothetical protein